MRSVRGNAYKGMIASTVLALALSAGASPLPRDAASASRDGRVERRLNEADLALNDLRLDLVPESSSTNNYAQFLGTDGSRRFTAADPQVFDLGQAGSERSMPNMLRGFVTVRRSSAQPSGAQPRASNRQPPDDSMGIDLGLSTNEWVRESVQGVIASVLSLSVDERGQASFSVLGLGDFSVVISADRSELALRSGDDVLTTAHRVATPVAVDAGHPGYANEQGGYASAPAPGPVESPIRRALLLAWEVASHPLSVMVYALIAGYALVWTILSGRARRRPSVRGSRHSSVLRAAAVIPAPAVRRPRKRVRVRVRVRKYRSSS